MPHTVVVGAGISGLTCAYNLHKQGDDVLLIEASSRAGGEIHSERTKGYLIEYGPNSLRGKVAELSELLNNLGLTQQVIPSSAAANRRYILRNGKPVLLPKNPFDLLTTKIITGRAKLRALYEPFVSRNRVEDESVQEFFERRLGKEIVDYLVAPYLCGVFAGKADSLSAKHTFRGLWDFEQSKGSILRGALQSRKKNAPSSEQQPIRGIFSFAGGLNELPNALCEALGDRIAFGTPVESVSKCESSFQVTIAGSTIVADRLILATPGHVSAQLVRSISPETTTALENIYYAPIVVVHLGFKTEQFQTPPIGFGMLVPPVERKQYLGAIFSSSFFPDRAPEGHTLISVLLGGAVRPELLELSDEALFNIATRELREAIPFTGEPDFRRIVRWQSAIPQYSVGYDRVLDALSLAESKNSGLHFLGSYRGGIAIGDCVRTATQLAKSLV